MHNPFAKKLPNRFAFSFDGFHKFTFKERLKILFGFNAKTVSRVLVDKRTHQVRAATTFKLTDQVSAQEQARVDAIEDAEGKP